MAQSDNFHRSCIYRWLRQCVAGEFDELERRKSPEAQPVTDSELDEWLKRLLLPVPSTSSAMA